MEWVDRIYDAPTFLQSNLTAASHCDAGIGSWQKEWSHFRVLAKVVVYHVVLLTFDGQSHCWTKVNFASRNKLVHSRMASFINSW